MKSNRDFNELPKNEQVYTLFRDGKEVFTRTVKSYVIRLFVVFDQFVEIWYNADKNLIEKIESVTDRDLYKNYGDKINLSELLER
jgi:hypothetical protein